MTMQEEEDRCTEPAKLRAMAAEKRSRANQLRLELMNLPRDAAQLDHEAGLWEVCDAAEDALDALKQKTAPLEAAEQETLAGQRAAEDAVRDEKRHVAGRKGEVTKAEGGTNREAQDEAAVRLHRSQKRLADAEQALAAATAKHEGAATALDAHREALREAQSAWQRALEAGFSPGIAPFAGWSYPGIGRLEDMTPAERSSLAFALAALGAIGTPARKAPEPELANGDPRLTLARQDPREMRYMRTPTGTIAIPPRRP